MYLQCLFKLDPTKMVKAHVMHIIIHKCEILFCRHGKEPVKVMTGYNTQHICIVKTALLVPYSFLDQTDFPLWKCQLLWNRNDLSFSKSSSLDVFWNFLCGIFNMYNVHWKYLLFVSRVASFGLPTLPVITTPSTNSLSGGGIGVLGLQQFFICFI